MTFCLTADAFLPHKILTSERYKLALAFLWQTFNSVTRTRESHKSA